MNKFERKKSKLMSLKRDVKTIKNQAANIFCKKQSQVKSESLVWFELTFQYIRKKNAKKFRMQNKKCWLLGF